MTDHLSIQPLDFEELGDIHFGDIKWRLPFQDPGSTFRAEYHHLFHINRIEDLRDMISFPLPPHRKMVNDCIFLTKGASVRSKGLNNYEFGENQFFFLPAYQMTSHEFMSENAEGYFLHFDSEMFRTLSQKKTTDFPVLHFWTNPIVTIPPETKGPILNILERLSQLYLDLVEADLGLVVSYLVALITEVSRFAPEEEKHAKSSAAYLTQQYKNALVQYIYQFHTVQEYADLLHVTPNHLNKCVKNTLNKTAQELLKEMVVLEAKSLLKFTQLTISEVAYKLGRQTPSNFVRFFKSQTGMTPKKYVCNNV